MSQTKQTVFAKNLAQILKIKGLDYIRISQELGLSVSTTYNWLHKGAIPHSRNIDELERYLELKPGSLLTDPDLDSKDLIMFNKDSGYSETLLKAIISELEITPDNIRQSILNLLVSIRTSRK